MVLFEVPEDAPLPPLPAKFADILKPRSTTNSPLPKPNFISCPPTVDNNDAPPFSKNGVEMDPIVPLMKPQQQASIANIETPALNEDHEPESLMEEDAKKTLIEKEKMLVEHVEVQPLDDENEGDEQKDPPPEDVAEEAV